MGHPFSRSLLSSALFLGTSFSAFAAPDVEYADKKSENDMDALRRWLNDKRLITVRELGGDLSLSGDVRTEMQATNERKNDIQQRGPGSPTGIPMYAWDVDVSIMLDYRTDYTWASVKLRFDNDMGIRSGTLEKIKLQKAYLGGRMVAGDTFYFDGEIGRRSLSNTYESKIEFGALYDGILLRFNKAFPSIGDFYFNSGPFLVSDKTNHYGYVGELGGLRIGNVGVNAKYSVIDWKKHFSNPAKEDRYNFVVQQFLLSYQFNPAWIGKRLIKFYSAGLNNIIADDLILARSSTDPTKVNFGKQNWGWYAGVSIGTLKKSGDWAIDINYQWAQAQVVPDYDFMGIGRGNTAGVGLYTEKINDTSSTPTTAQTAVGPCNYYGFEIDCLYAFTDNLSIEENFKWSRTLDENLGPNLKYQQFEIEFIYAY